ncbi:MAG TPA: helix-turn-helix transcriptional regulator [Anaerolineales bacterium]|nr:helix-turn-helix transcriptional regulator [Anaerolineales bacterium]
MPGGWGTGRGQGRRRRVMSFLQPCLLFMLKSGEAHGYSLLNGLDEFGFDLERLDPSLVYRALRDMEDSGWVVSNWGEESQGPQRRVYKILPEGEEHLVQWVADLRRTRDEIDRLLCAYENQSQSITQTRKEGV